MPVVGRIRSAPARRRREDASKHRSLPEPPLLPRRSIFAESVSSPHPRAARARRQPKIALLQLGRWPAERSGKAVAHTRIGSPSQQPPPPLPPLRLTAMFDDLLKLFRNSPRWANSPLARRLGFSAELSYEDDDAESLSDWTRVATSGNRPPVRSGHSALVVDDMMYIFGGYNDGNCHNDIYAFDLIRHHWTRIETSNGISPDGRASHAWCVSTDKSKLYLFGGSGPHWGQTNMGKLLQFSIRDKNWTIVDAEGAHPPPGYGQSLCSIDNKLYLFGGTSGHVYVNDLYIFDELTKVWRKVETTGKRPSPRYKHQVATVGKRMYVVGGGLYDPPKGPIDTFYLDVDTLTWHYLECSGDVPKSRIAHTISQMSSDPARILMFGGRDDSGTRRNELSELNVNTGVWRIFEPQDGCQPDARDFHSSVVHEDQLFVFGGSNGVERNNDVYRYTIMHQPSTLLILAMQTLRRNLADVPVEAVDALPYELRVGVQNINPDVCSPYNTTWFALDDQKPAAGVMPSIM